MKNKILQKLIPPLNGKSIVTRLKAKMNGRMDLADWCWVRNGFRIMAIINIKVHEVWQHLEWKSARGTRLAAQQLAHGLKRSRLVSGTGTATHQNQSEHRARMHRAWHCHG